MSYEQKNNSGSIFNNDRKERDAHPDRTGSAMIDGVAYWVSGWVKQDRNGNQYLSLAFKPKEARQERQAAPPQPAPGPRRASADIGRDMDGDEIPF